MWSILFSSSGWVSPTIFSLLSWLTYKQTPFIELLTNETRIVVKRTNWLTYKQTPTIYWIIDLQFIGNIILEDVNIRFRMRLEIASNIQFAINTIVVTFWDQTICNTFIMIMKLAHTKSYVHIASGHLGICQSQVMLTKHILIIKHQIFIFTLNK